MRRMGDVIGMKPLYDRWRAIDSEDPSPHDAVMAQDVTRHEMDARLSATEARVTSTLAEMKAELAGFRADVREGFAGMREEIASVRADHAKEQVVATRWQVGLIAAILLGAAATVTTVVVRTAPMRTAAPMAAPSPIQPVVIQVPATPQPEPRQTPPSN